MNTNNKTPSEQDELTKMWKSVINKDDPKMKSFLNTLDQEAKKQEEN